MRSYRAYSGPVAAAPDPSIPVPPDGFVFLLGADDAYLIGADGAYLLGVA